MNNFEIKDEIIRLLEEVVKKTHEINRRHPSADMLIEIDMVKDDLKRLYRSFDALRNSGGGEEKIPEAKQEEEDTQPPAEPEPEKEEKKEEAEKPLAGNGTKAVIDTLSGYKNHTIGDQYIKEEDDSLHNMISGKKEDRSIGTRMQQKPIESIKDVIGVNEKFLFINELFNGNIQAYHDAIAKLNSMDDVTQAIDYLNAIGMEYSWDASKSATTIEKLANYVQRRYLPL